MSSQQRPESVAFMLDGSPAARARACIKPNTTLATSIEAQGFCVLKPSQAESVTSTPTVEGRVRAGLSV